MTGQPLALGTLTRPLEQSWPEWNVYGVSFVNAAASEIAYVITVAPSAAVLAATSAGYALEILVTAGSAAGAATSAVYARWVPVDAMSNVAGATSASYTGSYFAQALSLVQALSTAVGNYPSRVGVNPAANTWVINTDTAASSQYDDYGFNSFAPIDGGYIAAADDGLYLLEGATDNGTPIDWMVQLPTENFGTHRHKRFPDVWVGLSSTNKVYLKVAADGETYTYLADTNTATVQNNHVELGRGLSGVYWSFTLIGTADAEIESIDFTPVVLQQKR